MPGENVVELNRKSCPGAVAALLFPVLAALFAATAPAGAQAAWTAPEDMTFASYAMLPAPEPGTPVTGGLLICNAQAWTLSLALLPGETIGGTGGRATLTARGQPFSVSSAASAGLVNIEVPYQALEPLKAGLRLQIDFEGEDRPVRFALAGSRRAITAVEGACSARELPTENRVELLAGSPWLELGRRLRSDDIRDFVISTSALPDLRVAMMEFDGGRQLFFVEICGSSWYYGVSGCNVAGLSRIGGDAGDDAADADTAGWRQVFESEGVHLYTQPDSVRDGWPDLVAIPLRPGFEDKFWAWDGERYAVQAGFQAELRTGQ